MYIYVRKPILMMVMPPTLFAWLVFSPQLSLQIRSWFALLFRRRTIFLDFCCREAIFSDFLLRKKDNFLRFLLPRSTIFSDFLLRKRTIFSDFCCREAQSSQIDLLLISFSAQFHLRPFYSASVWMFEKIQCQLVLKKAGGIQVWGEKCIFFSC